jgi:hypothetical protein
VDLYETGCWGAVLEFVDGFSYFFFLYYMSVMGTVHEDVHISEPVLNIIFRTFSGAKKMFWTEAVEKSETHSIYKTFFLKSTVVIITGKEARHTRIGTLCMHL